MTTGTMPTMALALKRMMPSFSLSLFSSTITTTGAAAEKEEEEAAVRRTAADKR